ncbi:MAG: DUF1737 domain-containing protein [Thermoplasmatota archaeon]
MPTYAPPNGLPIYRLLAGPDDEAFCRRVSEALALGYKLYGSPGIAIIWPTAEVAIAQPMEDSAPKRRK